MSQNQSQNIFAAALVGGAFVAWIAAHNRMKRANQRAKYYGDLADALDQVGGNSNTKG
jgi:hypothetical protein